MARVCVWAAIMSDMKLLHHVAATGHLASTPGFSDPATAATLVLAALTAGYLHSHGVLTDSEFSIGNACINQ